MTRGIANTLPEELHLLLWELVEEARQETELDYLQVFELTPEQDVTLSTPVQKIIHRQEQPPYKKEYLFPIEQTVEEKIFIIDSHTYATCMLAREY